MKNFDFSRQFLDLSVGINYSWGENENNALHIEFCWNLFESTIVHIYLHTGVICETGEHLSTKFLCSEKMSFPAMKSYSESKKFCMFAEEISCFIEKVSSLREEFRFYTSKQVFHHQTEEKNLLR